MRQRKNEKLDSEKASRGNSVKGFALNEIREGWQQLKEDSRSKKDFLNGK